ncbi:hypothetical protein CL634_02120 [bacterium]|nr:hypothetical protein [bacterium]
MPRIPPKGHPNYRLYYRDKRLLAEIRELKDELIIALETPASVEHKSSLTRAISTLSETEDHMTRYFQLPYLESKDSD